MIWIKDIWIYFIDEPNIPIAYIDDVSGQLFFESNDFTAKIPRCFKRTELLRKYIYTLGNKKLIKTVKELDDAHLPRFYHQNYAPYPEIEGDVYSLYPSYGKKIIFDFAEQWCINNGFKYCKKDPEPWKGLSYLIT